jgi:hypothetical protein
MTSPWSSPRSLSKVFSTSLSRIHGRSARTSVLMLEPGGPFCATSRTDFAFKPWPTTSSDMVLEILGEALGSIPPDDVDEAGQRMPDVSYSPPNPPSFVQETKKTVKREASRAVLYSLCKRLVQPLGIRLCLWFRLAV